jgi:hypothetical protein
MPYLITALLFLLIIGIAFSLAKKTKLQADNELPYQKIRTLLSSAERSFLGVLEKSLGSDYRVFCKIRLADVVKVKNGLSRAAGQRAFNSISAKHVDFLICGASDMSIRGVIELDDRTHNNPLRVRSDLFVDKLFEGSQIPFLRVKARAGYSISEITVRLESCGIIKAESIQGLLFNDKNEVENGRESINAKIESGETTPSIDLKIEAVCPRCGAGLVQKVATKGRYAEREIQWIQIK